MARNDNNLPQSIILALTRSIAALLLLRGTGGGTDAFCWSHFRGSDSTTLGITRRRLVSKDSCFAVKSSNAINTKRNGGGGLASTSPLVLFAHGNNNHNDNSRNRNDAKVDVDDDTLPNSGPKAGQALNGRRHFLSATTIAVAAGTSMPTTASAGIDVSGLRVEGGGSNSVIREQLKSIDGSASARANQIRELQQQQPASPAVLTNKGGTDEEVDDAVATWLYRANPGIGPRLARSGPLGNLYRCDDSVVGPSSSSYSSVGIVFEFPSDWLQLDKYLGGISYVDQRNGSRLYLLKTRLPDGERLSTVPKSFFGSSIFDPKGTIVKSQGIEIDDYKVSSVQTIDDCPEGACSTHKRYKMKYSTITGNGLRVERRALVDAYEMSTKGDVYMMMTTSNALKFDNKDGPERKTVEAIVDSFRINV